LVNQTLTGSRPPPAENAVFAAKFIDDARQAPGKSKTLAEMSQI
jgi:hypothetical protein